jgi:tetratricopeptide (TPR) repeat protein
MATLGFCIVAFNEDEVFDVCLASIKDIADEIIIVLEPETNQKTKDIAKQYTDKIYFNKLEDWSTSFSHANDLATADYLINWDADFVLRPSSLSHFNKLKKQDFQGLDSIVLHWNIEFTQDYKKPLTWVKRKLIHKKGNYTFTHPLHPRHVFTPKRKEKIGYFPQIAVDHYNTYQNRKPRYQRFLKIMKKLIDTNPNDAESLFYYGEELIFAKRFGEAKQVFETYLEHHTDDPLNRLVYGIHHYCHVCIELGLAQQAQIKITKFEAKFKGKSAIFDLISADVMLANNNVDGCISAYKSFINSYTLDSDQNKFDISDYYRLSVYPYFILAKIYKLLDKTESSLHYANLAHTANIEPARESQIKFLL